MVEGSKSGFWFLESPLPPPPKEKDFALSFTKIQKGICSSGAVSFSLFHKMEFEGHRANRK